MIVIHVKKDAVISTGKWPTRTQIEPIIFLSRLLTEAERNYWPTELEVTRFVWVIKKVRYLVKLSKYSTIIQTNYLAILDIIK